MKVIKLVVAIISCLLFTAGFNAGLAQKGKLASKPLFVDPVFDGAADPVIIWNKQEAKWFMFYTNRKANAQELDGVSWVHGTRIGIAESVDGGATWKYRDTANINYRPQPDYTFWAPDVIESEGIYHMYLTYVPGIFTDWRHPRSIIHCTSNDLINWQYESTLPLASDRVIDASVFKLPTGGWRMWYNNEMDGKSIYYADSKDLFTWQDGGKVIGDRGCEGPKVFKWKGKYWMVTDFWKGLSVYESTDLKQWKKQVKPLLDKPGAGLQDAAYGGHADVVVRKGRAWLFYFTHPGNTAGAPPPTDKMAGRRSIIQVAELKYENGEMVCNRDLPTYIRLPK